MKNIQEKIDKIDEELIKEMGRDAREGPRIIEKKFRVSPSTIRRRVAQLVKNGIMRVVGVCDPAKVGYPICAILGFSIDYKDLESVVDDLKKHNEIRWLAVTTGRFDAIGLVYLNSFEELSELLRNKLGCHKGLKGIESFVSLYMAKGAYVPIFREEE